MEYCADLSSRCRVSIPKVMRDQPGWQPAGQIRFTHRDGKLKKGSLPPVETPGDAIGAEADVAVDAIIRRLEP